MPRITELEVSQIETNPKNYRTIYTGIEKLAESIVRYGLLQNLVVIEYERGKYHVHAGERRYRAIKMLCMQNTVEGQARWQGKVPCLVLTKFGLEDYEENSQRQKTAIWNDGERFAREIELTGLDQVELASRLGTTQSKVSEAMNIYRGLHPTVVKYLNNAGPDALPNKHLMMICKLRDAAGDPDETAQVAKLFDFMRDRKKPKQRNGSARYEQQNILERVKRLELKRVPLHAKPYVDIMIAYLKGEARLKF